MAAAKLRSLLVPLLLVAGSVARAAPDADNLLGRAVSPGAVLLLVPHAGHLGVAERWHAALADARAEVRAAAARAAHAAGAVALVPAIATALAAETDPGAAREQAWALATLGAPDAAREHAARLGPEGQAILEALAARAQVSEHGPLPDVDTEWLGAPRPRDRPMPLPRLDGEWPRGLVASVLRESGCKPRDETMAAALVTYGADGRPESVELLRAPGSEKCRTAVSTLFLAALAAPSAPLAAAPESVVIPLLDAWPTCGHAQFGDGAPLKIDAEAGVSEPKLVKQAAPRYPNRARSRGTTGTVQVDAVIARAGCVGRARVSQATDFDLALEALRSLLEWRFEPGALHGKPVNTILTLMVKFDLQLPNSPETH